MRYILLGLIAWSVAGCTHGQKETTEHYASRTYTKSFLTCLNNCANSNLAADEAFVQKCDDVCSSAGPKYKRPKQSTVDYDALAKASGNLSKSLAGASDAPTKKTDMQCFNGCTSHGHEWDFCHSKCDY